MPTTPLPISDCFAATVFALQISGTVRDTPPTGSPSKNFPRAAALRSSDRLLHRHLACRSVIDEPVRPCRGRSRHKRPRKHAPERCKRFLSEIRLAR